MKKYIAELIGTFVLVLFGCGTAIFAGKEVGYLGISFAFGLSVVAMAYTLGSISGCHLNPAISLAMYINNRINLKDFICYVVFQVIGGILAGLTLMLVAKSFLNLDSIKNLGQNFLANDNIALTFFIEFLLTFIFVLVVINTTSKINSNVVTGLIIGLTLTLIHLIGIPLTGTSVNPARSIGPALFTTVDNLWIFIFAPLLGGSVAAFISKYVLDSEK